MENSTSQPAASARTFGAIDAALVGMTFIWGLNFIVVKSALGQISPIPFVALRFLIAAVCFLVILRVRPGGAGIPRRAWGKLLLIGFIGTTIYQPLYISGLALTTASNSALILAATPTFIALINRLLGRERLARRGWLGIGLSFLGIALIVESGENLWLNPGALAGDLLVLAGTVCWSVYSVMVAPLVKQYSSLSITAISTIFGALLLALFSVPALLQQDWGQVSPAGWAALGYSAVFAIVIAYIIWNHGVRVLGGARTAMFNNLTPVIATLAAVVFLGETLTVLKLVGAAIISVGLYLARTSNLVIEAEG